MTDSIDHTKDGFTIKFRVGNHKNFVRFPDGSINDTIGNIVMFLLGCGFTRSAIVAGLKQAADVLEAAP